MSKIGKKPIDIPQNVTIKPEAGQIRVIGEKGEVVVKVPSAIEVNLIDGQIQLKTLHRDKQTKSDFGTTRSLLANAVKGVTEGWKKKLEVVGTGFRVEMQDKDLVLTLGFSHPVKVSTPPDLSVSVSENQITVAGVDRQRVGLFAANLRQISPPDAYQGKGIRYLGEKIKIKPGKMTKTGSDV